MSQPQSPKQKFSTSNDISELWRGQSIELLKELHILTRDSKLNADSRRKLKQVYHLTQFIEPILKDIYATSENPTLVDVGSGKSYLGFILYDLILRNHSAGKLISIESRADLVERAKKLATDSGFERMEFLASNIDAATIKNTASLVCALHACDTATDDAILFGLKHDTENFVLVPCCQGELARQFADKKSLPATPLLLEPLWHEPLHRREFASHLTNVMRVLFLESKGYTVTVTELIGWEHSMKNELIIARKIPEKFRNKASSEKAREKLELLMRETGVKPKFLNESR